VRILSLVRAYARDHAHVGPVSFSPRFRDIEEEVISTLIVITAR